MSSPDVERAAIVNECDQGLRLDLPPMLSDAERERLDELSSELAARSEQLEVGSLSSHLAALGDVGLARAAYQRSQPGWDLENSNDLALHLSRVAASETPAICVSPRVPQNPRRAVSKVVTATLRVGWTPSASPAPQPLRRELWKIRSAVRWLAPPRQRNCGWAMTSSGGGVGILADRDGRARFSGLQSCGSVWGCPTCASSIRAKRADEIGQVVTIHGRDRVAMMTLTVRHSSEDHLLPMRKRLANAYRALTRGKPWRSFVSSLGIVGTVRAVEVTHGPNGWHPHIHVLIFLDELPRGVVQDDGWHPAGGVKSGSQKVELLQWLRLRWKKMVARYMGDKHEPDLEIGVHLSSAVGADYLAKIGLELQDPRIAKVSTKGHRTPMMIAAHYGDRRRPQDAQLWKHYAADMKGARMLTWSRGARWLRDQAGIVDRSDQELADDEVDLRSDDVLVGVIPWTAWEAIRSMTFRGQQATTWFLSTVESAGSAVIPAALEELYAASRQQSHTKKRARSP